MYKHDSKNWPLTDPHLTPKDRVFIQKKILPLLNKMDYIRALYALDYAKSIIEHSSIFVLNQIDKLPCRKRV